MFCLRLLSALDPVPTCAGPQFSEGMRPGRDPSNPPWKTAPPDRCATCNPPFLPQSYDFRITPCRSFGRYDITLSGYENRPYEGCRAANGRKTV